MNKKIFTKIISLILLLSSQTYATQDLYGKTFFSPRSQTARSARRLVGQTPHMHKRKGEKCYATVAATAEYLRSYRERRLAEYFFGTDKLLFSGSQSTDRGSTDILADYFGLSPEYRGTLKLNPHARTFVMDFNTYVGLDCWHPGLYFRLSLPVVSTRHWICLEEDTLNAGNNAEYPAKYMTTDALAAPAKGPARYFEGDFTWGHVSEGIKFGKIGCARKTGVSDIWFTFGWNFLRRERGHFGFNLQMAAPTGSKPNGTYMFEPVVGNGDHWEFGVGFNGNALLWESDVTREIHMNIEANFTHLFKATQCRTFDFKDEQRCRTTAFGENKFGSRFILLKEFDTAGQYTGTLIPAINKTTLACKVSNALKIDLTIMATYNDSNWVVDLGYNGWIRTKDKLCLCGSIEKNKYALKGIQDVADTGADETQSNATLTGNTLDTQTQAENADANQTFIATEDLDLCSATMPTSISHMLFAHASYTWDRELWEGVRPFLGVGFQLEFEGIRHSHYTAPDKNTMSNYGFWLKGGLEI